MRLNFILKIMIFLFLALGNNLTFSKATTSIDSDEMFQCKGRMAESMLNTVKLFNEETLRPAPKSYIAAKGISNYNYYYFLLLEYNDFYQFFIGNTIGEINSKKIAMHIGEKFKNNIVGHLKESEQYNHQYNKNNIHNSCDFVEVRSKKDNLYLEYFNFGSYNPQTPEEVLLANIYSIISKEDLYPNVNYETPIEIKPLNESDVLYVERIRKLLAENVFFELSKLKQE